MVRDSKEYFYIAIASLEFSYSIKSAVIVPQGTLMLKLILIVSTATLLSALSPPSSDGSEGTGSDNPDWRFPQCHSSLQEAEGRHSCVPSSNGIQPTINKSYHLKVSVLQIICRWEELCGLSPPSFCGCFFDMEGSDDEDRGMGKMKGWCRLCSL